MKRNSHFLNLNPNYLFPEIAKRKNEFLSKNPQAQLISLGVGDTTEPIPLSIVNAMSDAANKLGTRVGYTGYGPEQGLKELREKIANKFYYSLIKPEEVFVSDGAKCDLGRLQQLFGPNVSIAVQDPSYPVYIDGSLLIGVNQIVPLVCRPENNFFPNLSTTPRTDLIYFCSPNNPTGAIATRSQLNELVDFARKNHSIIIYDSAYSHYIQDADFPVSIYEIEGAQEVAIEVSSFSKIAGFTGVRLGWTIVPEALKYDDGKSVKADWYRLTSTIFNGASNIVQKGGCAILEDEGWIEVCQLAKFYLENTRLVKECLDKLGYQTYGSHNVPYIWVKFKGKTSWDIFQTFLERYHIVVTPGSGFGPGGEEFVRFSAFGHREIILEAIRRLEAGSFEKQT